MNDTNYKLRAWMGANRVSGVKMAEMIGMPYATFKYKLSDKSEWTLSEIIAIMAATGCEFNEIFFYRKLNHNGLLVDEEA